MEIKITKTASPKQKPDWSNLGFGNYYTDHMFLMNYDEGEGWHDPGSFPTDRFRWTPPQWCSITDRRSSRA